MSSDHEFWPNGARLAVTVSMQFEAGGQPLSDAGGPITEPIMEGYPGLGRNSFYEYGAREEVRASSTCSTAQWTLGHAGTAAGSTGSRSGQRAPGAQPVTRRVVRDLPLDRPPPPGQVSDTR
jgi:hypothetical protein